ncbi:histidine kinase [Halobacteriales archaeon QS_9_67_17]|nr:MAG: histidine kinase [Halobacteriales archaeon QS_9_67_17]
MDREGEAYETLAEMAPEAFVTIDEQGTIRSANPAVEDIFGYDPDEVVGEPLTVLMPDRLHESLRRYLETGERTLDWEYVELSGRHKDGHDVPLAVSFTEYETDAERLFTGIIRDIAERTDRQREFERTRRRYQTLVENFPNGVVALVDEDLRYLTFGGTLEGDTDTPRANIEGEPVREVLPRNVADLVVPHYESALDGDSSMFESTVDDSVYQFHFIPVRDDDGTVSTALGMSQDITERKQYERQLNETIEKLQTSNERLEQFAYAVSHDLQEPLRMISSYLQLLETRYADALDEDAEEFIDFAVDGADRMRAMIEGLLEYSRVATRGGPLEPIDADDVLDEALADLHLQIEEADATVTADDLPTVTADPDQIGQVFRNLISNAIEYSGERPPEVHVSADRVDDAWRFAVADRGIGITPDQHGRIFDIFETVHTIEEGAGSGIGLALCQRIVERHGGDIWVDSELGEGATFYFTIPTE